MSAAGNKKRAGKHVHRAHKKPRGARRPRVEDHEHAMDAQFHDAHTIWQTDLYDSAQDARSEARYEADPQAELEQAPFNPGEPVFSCLVDESAGFRG